MYIFPLLDYLSFIKRLDVCTKQDQEREEAFSYLFCTHLTITLSAMVSGRLGAMSRMEVFFIKHESHVTV